MFVNKGHLVSFSFVQVDSAFPLLEVLLSRNKRVSSSYVKQLVSDSFPLCNKKKKRGKFILMYFGVQGQSQMHEWLHIIQTVLPKPKRNSRTIGALGLFFTEGEAINGLNCCGQRKYKEKPIRQMAQFGDHKRLYYKTRFDKPFN